MARIELHQLAANVTRIDTTKGAVIFSYNTPVALVIFKGGRMVRVDRFYSQTTAKHMAQHCAGFEKVTEEEFTRLLGEIA